MEELLAELTERPVTEKGDRGQVGVIAGSVDQAGPPALVGEAALRTGSDLVKVLTSDEVVSVVAGYSENFVVHRYFGDHLSDGSVSRARELAEWSDVLVIGPGLSEPDQDAVRHVVDATAVPLVVDADAIEPALDADVSASVFTPDGEEATHIREAYGSLEAFSEETGAVVVSTGPADEIIDGTDRWTNDTGTSAMTVGGTGDVLTGAIASMIGQGMSRRDAARLGTWVVGRAGERGAEEYGIGLTATDIVEHVPSALMDR